MRFRIPTLLVLATALVGCGRSDLPPLADVSGIALLDGEPLPNAIIGFKPIAGGRPSQGITDEQGRFEMSTFEIGDGALIGDHMITVNPLKPPPPGYVERPGRTGGYVAPFPKRYWSYNSSGFTTTVEARGDNELTLELESR